MSTSGLVVLKSRQVGRSIWMTQDERRAMQILQDKIDQRILEVMWGIKPVKKKRIRRKMKKHAA